VPAQHDHEALPDRRDQGHHACLQRHDVAGGLHHRAGNKLYERHLHAESRSHLYQPYNSDGSAGAGYDSAMPSTTIPIDRDDYNNTLVLAEENAPAPGDATGATWVSDPCAALVD